MTLFNSLEPKHGASVYLSRAQWEATSRWLQTSKCASHSRRERAERWCEETDPFRARALYQMASLGYQARTGQIATPARLNREYPASCYPPNIRKPSSHGSWNLVRLGKHLPRSACTKMGHAMRALEKKDPEAAAVFDWVLWPLASKQRMTLAQVHSAMLWLGLR